MGTLICDWCEMHVPSVSSCSLSSNWAANFISLRSVSGCSPAGSLNMHNDGWCGHCAVCRGVKQRCLENVSRNSPQSRAQVCPSHPLDWIRSKISATRHTVWGHQCRAAVVPACVRLMRLQSAALSYTWELLSCLLMKHKLFNLQPVEDLKHSVSQDVMCLVLRAEATAQCLD